MSVCVCVCVCHITGRASRWCGVGSVYRNRYRYHPLLMDLPSAAARLLQGGRRPQLAVRAARPPPGGPHHVRPTALRPPAQRPPAFWPSGLWPYWVGQACRRCSPCARRAANATQAINSFAQLHGWVRRRVCACGDDKAAEAVRERSPTRVCSMECGSPDAHLVRVCMGAAQAVCTLELCLQRGSQ